MQVNRINQSNQQTNFKAAYAQLKPGQWMNLADKFEIPSLMAMGIFAKATKRLDLTLTSGRVPLGGDVYGCMSPFPVVLTESEVERFNSLSEHSSRQRKFLKDLFKGILRFDTEFKFTVDKPN